MSNQDKEHVCICNNCGELFIDTNPQTGQRIYEIDAFGMQELIGHECPNCETDGHLMDVNEDIEEVYSHTVESIEVWIYQIVKS